MNSFADLLNALDIKFRLAGFNYTVNITDGGSEEIYACRFDKLHDITRLRLSLFRDSIRNRVEYFGRLADEAELRFDQSLGAFSLGVLHYLSGGGYIFFKRFVCLIDNDAVYYSVNCGLGFFYRISVVGVDEDFHVVPASNFDQSNDRFESDKFPLPFRNPHNHRYSEFLSPFNHRTKAF